VLESDQKQVDHQSRAQPRIGRLPLRPDMRASTVYLPQAAFVELETLRGKSGKKGSKRLGLTETARAVIRLVFGREWLPEKSEKLFPNLKSRGGDIQRVLFATVVDAETTSSPRSFSHRTPQGASARNFVPRGALTR